MGKMQKVSFVILLCAGVTFWTPPCYSFGFPTFDIAEVGGTIKGVVTSAQSLSSTVQSTISQGKELLALGDNLSSITKFRDLKGIADKIKAKAERIKKTKERLEKIRKKLDDAKNKVEGTINDVKGTIDGVKGTIDDVKGKVDDVKGTINDIKGKVDDVKGTINDVKGKVDDVKGTISDVKGKVDNVKDQVGGAVSGLKGEINGVRDQVTGIKDKVGGAVAGVKVPGGSTGNTPAGGQNGSVSVDLKSPVLINDGFMFDNDSPKTPSVRLNIGGLQGEAPARGFVTQTGVDEPVKGEDAGENAETPAESTDETDGENTPPVLAPLTPKARVDLPTTPATDDKTSATGLTAPVIAPTGPGLLKLKTPVRGFKSSSIEMFEDEFCFSLTSSSSYAQASGTNEDGRFLFSEIIAAKCNMGYEDAEDSEKVHDCIQTWVECMAGLGEDGNKDATNALLCQEEYSKAMHEHVAADLTSSISDKEYANSFESDVAEDMENKADGLSNERDDVSYVAEIGKTNQELLLRLMRSMSSRMLQESFKAVEDLDVSYYEDEGN